MTRAVRRRGKRLAVRPDRGAGGLPDAGCARIVHAYRTDDNAPARPPALLAPTPTLRQAASEDPETLANRAGELVATPAPPREPQVVSVNPDGRQVRVVGPEYYVAQ